MSRTRCRATVFVVAAVLASAIAFDLWRMPVQVADALVEMIDAQGSSSIGESFGNALGTTSYLRPLRIAQIKALFDWSGGNYHLAYRGFHVVLIVALVLLFARALAVESVTDTAAAIMALTILTGMHTFLSFLREAFPINHFLEIAVLVLVALNLAVSRSRWVNDVLAGLAFVVAALTLESGVLVWVVIASAWIVGFRGVSIRGVGLVTVLLCGYFALRFVYLDTGLPSLDERASGFLLERLEASQIKERFSSQPLPFYAYNVGVAVVSVLFAEPRDGVFVATRVWLQGDVHPRVYLSVGSSLATTMLMFMAAIVWWRQQRPFGHAERLAIVAIFVIAANAVLSFPYSKDDIIAVGGVFYAFAAYAALRVLVTFAQTGGFVRSTVVSVVMLVLASAWATRSSGVHHVTNEHAFRSRNDWAELPIRWQEQGRWPTTPGPLALIERLRNAAIETPVPNPQMLPEWRGRWYGE